MSLFGTDGVRGRANALLTPELAVRLARAAAHRLARPGGRAIIGRDTRTSGPMIEASLASGLASAGIDVYLAGVIPTPAISFLIKDERADLGAVVSASHNPPGDNGIKLFDARGMKLTIEEERSIEAALADDLPAAERVGTIVGLEAAAASYAAFLSGTIDVEEIDLSSHTIVVDCAFGATGKIAPHVLRHLGAKVIELHTEPDGARINVDCGSTHLEAVRAAVADHSADLGIAFDGDGDRVLLVTRSGRTIDGDQMMGIVALHMLRKGTLSPAIVVATVMSNLGLEKGLADRGIGLVRTPVGDRNVSQAVVAHKAQLGGEQSGHIIFADHSPTGDGILTAVKLLEVSHEAAADLGTLADEIPLLPQIHRNIQHERPAEALDRAPVRKAIDDARGSLGERGRVIVRPSGTQPVIRLTVEAVDERLCEEVVSRLEEAISLSL
ncbi:MAG: phosphoglucosamine mutase [Candidatus Bipolaricaulia bacterium]